MKLATLKHPSSRDGSLVVVNKSLTMAVRVGEFAPNLQVALERWDDIRSNLEELYDALNQGGCANAFEFDNDLVLSPLPRAFQWLDGSAYLSHVRRVRQARGAEMPPSFLNDPLMYQGGSDTFLAPSENIPLGDVSWGADCEAEIAVVTGDVPMGIKAEDVAPHIKLIMLVNDVSLRNLIPAELAKGFGFLQSKPSSAFSPVAVTPEVLGEHWRDGKLHLPLHTKINDTPLGAPNAGDDMQFSFYELVAHAAKTRSLGAGTIIGSGTISNEDENTGCSCLAEKRVLEVIHQGEAKTPFLQPKDTVEIEMFDGEQQSIFGQIKQTVVKVG